MHARPPWILHFFQLADWNVRVNGRSSNAKRKRFLKKNSSESAVLSTRNTWLVYVSNITVNYPVWSRIFVNNPINKITRHKYNTKTHLEETIDYLEKIVLNETRWKKGKKVFLHSTRRSLASKIYSGETRVPEHATHGRIETTSLNSIRESKIACAGILKGTRRARVTVVDPSGNDDHGRMPVTSVDRPWITRGVSHATLQGSRPPSTNAFDRCTRSLLA